MFVCVNVKLIGRSSGGVGLRGPGEKQLESDRRQMKSKISIMNRSIDLVRRHRSMHRNRRKRLGLPVVALVGYTNSGKSTLLNKLAQAADVFTADMLFATLDPTTRLVQMKGMRNPDMLMTDTVGFIQKLPSNLIAAFRATLEEITEADVLLHVTDITNPAWRKQETAVLKELNEMGLGNKPLVTVWNKVDLVPDRSEYFKYEASKRNNTVALSAVTGEGLDKFTLAMEVALSEQMDYIHTMVSYNHSTMLNSIYNLGVLSEVTYLDDGIYIRGKVPLFLKQQLESLSLFDSENDESTKSSIGDINFDWTGLSKGRHDARQSLFLNSNSNNDYDDEIMYLPSDDELIYDLEELQTDEEVP